MITIVLWHICVSLVLAAVLGCVSLVQWAVRTGSARLRADVVQGRAAAQPTRPLVSGGAPRG